MQTSISVSVPYAVILIGDRDGQLPEDIRGRSVSATVSCVAVGCLPDADGETTIVVEDEDEAPGVHSQKPVFDGRLELPTGLLVVSSVVGEHYFERATNAANIRVRIWANHPLTPDRIVVRFGD